MVRVPAGQTDPENKGGSGIEKAGNYHFAVEKCEDFSQSDKPRLEFHLIVIGGQHADQIGKKIRETFWLTGDDEKKTASAMNRLTEFACAIGLYNKVQWRADKEANQTPDIPLESQSDGRQFCAPIEMRAYGGKDAAKQEQYRDRKFANFGFKFWAVGDEESDAVPKDPDYIGLFGPAGCALPTREGPPRVPGTKHVAPAGHGNGHGQQQHASTPPATTQPVTRAAASTPPAKPAASGFGANF